jgi:hypothetical protein
MKNEVETKITSIQQEHIVASIQINKIGASLDNISAFMAKMDEKMDTFPGQNNTNVTNQNTFLSNLLWNAKDHANQLLLTPTKQNMNKLTAKELGADEDEMMEDNNQDSRRRITQSMAKT